MRLAHGDGPFDQRAVLALVIVSVIAFCGLVVMLTYAPDLRRDTLGGANAVSRSAVGYTGLERSLRVMDVPVVVSRTPPLAGRQPNTLLILTPSRNATPRRMRDFGRRPTLIVLPKWNTRLDPARPGFVAKVGIMERANWAELILNPYSTGTRVQNRAGAGRAALFEPQARGQPLMIDQIDRLQTISGPGWIPLLTDEGGRMVLARSRQAPHVTVLADPDLLNNQGLAQRSNARAGLTIVERLRGDRAVVLDATLAGFVRGNGLLRLILEPPWLGATLCGLAAALLMGLHALGRFGIRHRETRAHAMGRRALVDNSAALVRMARKEPQMASAYADMTWTTTAQAAGVDRSAADRDAWLADIARQRGLATPEALRIQAQQAKTRDDLLRIAQKLYNWNKEAAGGRR